MRRYDFLSIATAAFFGLLILLIAYYLMKVGQPSADVLAKDIARIEAQFPTIKVASFEPGDVRILNFDSLPIIVWRRNDADRKLALSQNSDSGWKVKYTNVLGQSKPVFADDAKLTLDSEWFFAVARIPEGSDFVPLLRAGDFKGFFDIKYAGHYDLAGRSRHQGRQNLTVVIGEMSEDRSTITLNLGR